MVQWTKRQNKRQKMISEVPNIQCRFQVNYSLNFGVRIIHLHCFPPRWEANMSSMDLEADEDYLGDGRLFVWDINGLE